MNQFRPAKLQQKTLCLTLSLLSAVIITAGLALLSQPGPASANTSYDVGLARAAYPHITSTDFECILCHTRYGSRTLNAYGAAYRTNGRSAAALAALENIDTDGDGYFNIDEINALTSPADAADHPHDDLLARQNYPDISGTRLDDCALCHSSGSSLNPYGQAYRDNGRNLAAFGLIEAIDSDGDGYPNLDEIAELTFPGDAGDYPVDPTDDLTLALTQYPAIAGTRLDSCTLCHSSGAVLNPYGADYLAYGRSQAALGSIEGLDSDGDGYLNLAEITELTFPGNASDSPAAQHNYETLARQQYPAIVNTALDSCELCHHSDLSLNPYGTDYAASSYDFAAIEQLDSDDDNHTNLIELTLLAFPGDPDDYPDKMSLLLLKYPHLAGSPLHSCAICHTADWGLNPYGTDYLTYGANWQALGLIEPLDSDQDDYTNLAEITALTFPGDAGSNPAAATDNWQVFLPLLLK